MWASFAVQLIRKLTLECSFQDIMMTCKFQETLNTIHECVKELVSIRLNNWTDWLAFESDKWSTEIFCCLCFFVTILERIKYFLKLINFILVKFWLERTAFDGHKTFPETLYHKELLEKAVYVTCGAEVLQSNIQFLFTVLEM